MIIVEFLVEVFGQLVLELVLDGLGRVLGGAARSRTVKAVLGLGIAVAVGFGAGYWWGDRLTELGRTDPPRSLWVSIALAGVFAGFAVARAAKGRPFSERHVLFVPWRWPLLRLVSFAVMNAAAAAGIAAGFTPQALG